MTYAEIRKYCNIHPNLKSKINYTHLLLNGGCLRIPPEHVKGFYQAYARDVRQGNSVGVCERRTDVFRMFFDVDWKTERKHSFADYVELVRLIQKAVAFFLPPGQDNRVIVCARPPADKGNGVFHNGIHPIWPNLLVTQETALFLRIAVMQFMQKKKFEFGPLENIEKIFDVSVFQSNGLRMVGSRKFKKCKACRRGVYNACRFCMNSQYIDMGRVYVPIQVLASDGKEQPLELKRLLDDTDLMVRQTSIRTELKKQPFNLVARFPDWFKVKSIGKHVKITKKGKVSRIMQQERRVGRNRLRLAGDDARYKVIESFIETLHPEYKDIVVGALLQGENQDHYIARSDSNFCGNKQGSHANANVYFYIDRRGISQRCFCVCEEKRSSGKTCKNYRGKRKVLLPLVLEKFFPDQFAKNMAATGEWTKEQIEDYKVEQIFQKSQKKLKAMKDHRRRLKRASREKRKKRKKEAQATQATQATQAQPPQKKVKN